MTEHRDILAFPPRDEPSAAAEAGSNLQSAHCREVPGEDESGPTLRLADWARSTRGPQPVAWQELELQQAPRAVRICLGRARVAASIVDRAAPGTVVTLDTRADEPAEIIVDGEIVAYGRVVVVQGKLAIEICRTMERRVQRSA